MKARPVRSGDLYDVLGIRQLYVCSGKRDGWLCCLAMTPPACTCVPLRALARRNRKATKDDISKAFRRELMMYHPDHNQNTGLDPAAASERTRLIVEAYRTLKNPAKRRTYDATYR